MIVYLVCWLIFGLLVGALAKLIHPGDEPVGIVPTLVIGVVGSFVGGAISWLINGATGVFHPSGFIMSVLGGVVTCAAHRYWTLKFSSGGPKSFLNGKRR